MQAEGFVLAQKAGLSPSLVLEVLQASVASNPMIAAKLPQVLKRSFEPNFSLKWMHKDLGLMLESGRELNVPLPATALVHELFGASVAMGHGEEDFAAAITLTTNKINCRDWRLNLVCSKNFSRKIRPIAVNKIAGITYTRVRVIPTCTKAAPLGAANHAISKVLYAG